jgi:UDP-N-acetylglucosamine:LPS N-acetylglucosamine transferase
MVVITQNSDPGLLNNFTKKYCSTPLSNRVEMDQDRRIYTDYRTQQENFKKKVAQVWKITIFDRQTALFTGASMGAIR